jgi:hypothetical protein
MCGIAGIVNLGGAVEPPKISRLNDLLADHGPDGEGICFSDDRSVVFGHHRRLAIIDPGPGGYQHAVRRRSLRDHLCVRAKPSALADAADLVDEKKTAQRDRSIEVRRKDGIIFPYLNMKWMLARLA